MGTPEISAAIKSAREYRGLSQAEVAKRLGITYQALSNYERGVNRVPVDSLQKLCAIYNLSSEMVIASYYWRDGIYHDFITARSDLEREGVVKETKYPDPRIVCQFCDFIGAHPSSKVSEELSPDELNLISDYRCLNSAGKEYILQTMAMARQSYAEKNNAVPGMETA